MWLGIATHELAPNLYSEGWHFALIKGVVAITAMPTRSIKARKARFWAEVEYMKSLANERICASCAATYWLKAWLTRLGPNLYIMIHQCMPCCVNLKPGVHPTATLAGREEYNRLCETSKDCKCEDSDTEDASQGSQSVAAKK